MNLSGDNVYSFVFICEYNSNYSIVVVIWLIVILMCSLILKKVKYENGWFRMYEIYYIFYWEICFFWLVCEIFLELGFTYVY